MITHNAMKMINSQKELENCIVKLFEYKKDTKFKEINTQYNSFDDIKLENEITHLRDKQYMEICTSINNNVPINTWVKVKIEGQEKGFIHIYYKTRFGYQSGYYLKRWTKNMLSYSSFAMTRYYIEKIQQNRLFLLIMSPFLLALSIMLFITIIRAT